VALGGIVEHVRGEFKDHEQALPAAKDFVDQMAAAETALQSARISAGAPAKQSGKNISRG
jgi:hypothetical protein